MLRIKHTGDFRNVLAFMKRGENVSKSHILHKYGQMGVLALMEYTPKRTGLTSRSWSYTIDNKNDSTVITWNNSNIQGGHNIALLIQYGHGTGRGVYVQARNYINPALEPIFKQFADDIWKEVIGK